jgi:hypothetical protein
MRLRYVMLLRETHGRRARRVRCMTHALRDFPCRRDLQRVPRFLQETAEEPT